MTRIFITSWNRLSFLKKTIGLIQERTTPGSYSLNVFDNGSASDVRDYLVSLFKCGELETLLLDSRNTGCLYNKLVFDAMVENEDEYYCITDNDVFPPKIEPDWLKSMRDIMDTHRDIALLTPQLPPQSLQGSYQVLDRVVYAKAVGNTFKLCRTAAIKQVMQNVPQRVGAYGDDGLVSSLLEKEGWKVAFCRHIFCFHAGQCENWGYKPEEIARDPRKKGYGKPFVYPIVDEEKYLPPEHMRT